MEYDEALLKRFWNKVEKTDGCWLWTGCKRRGYGAFNVNGRLTCSHRISLELHLNRPITDGMLVAHQPLICHTRHCVNPAHLREATCQENILDKRIDGTVRTGENNTKPRKFTADQIRAIRNDTRPQKVICEEYGLRSREHVRGIKRRLSYAWVPD